MTSLECTQADDQLLAELAELGPVDYNPRKLRRLREEHLISSPTRYEGGRREGRPSVGYPPGTAAQVVAVHALRARGYSFRDVRFELLWRGRYPLPIEVIRADYRDLLDRMARLLPATPDPADAADKFVRDRFLAYSARTVRGRSQARRSGAPATKHGTILEDAHVSVIGLGYGTIGPEDVNLDAFAQVYGIADEDAAFVAETASLVALPIVRDRAARLTDADLARYLPLAHDYLFVADTLRNDPQAVAEFPGIVDQPECDDPVVRGFAIMSAIVMAESFPDWEVQISGAAKAIREGQDLRTIIE